MKQSRSTSLLKSVLSTASGFVLSLGIQYGVCWWYRLPLATSDNLVIIGVFTIASLARGYVLERIFEMLGWRVRLSAFASAVIAERQRQQDVEGWTPEHDDAHDVGELARAGSSYAVHAGGEKSDQLPIYWPWSAEWWKPAGFRRDLVKACALIVAEGEKFDRNRKQGRGR